MINIDLFLEELLKKINEILTCYYDEVPTNATFPYGVIPSISSTALNYGEVVLFTIEIYTNELNSDIESKLDALRNGLDGAIIKNQGKFSAHINFENRNSIKLQEQDMLARSIDFSARIFFI